jgi:hypothetical protein
VMFEPFSTEKKGEGQSEQRAEEELGSEMNLAKRTNIRRDCDIYLREIKERENAASSR